LRFQYGGYYVPVNCRLYFERQNDVEFVNHMVAQQQSSREDPAQASRSIDQRGELVDQLCRGMTCRQIARQFGVGTVERPLAPDHLRGNRGQRCAITDHEMGQHFVIAPFGAKAGARPVLI
jgi:hypothetical protein